MPVLPVCYLCSSSSGQCVNFSHVIYQPCLFHFLNLNLSLGKVPSQLHWYCFWLYWEQWARLLNAHIFRKEENKAYSTLTVFYWQYTVWSLSVITWFAVTTQRNANSLGETSARAPASRSVWWKRSLGRSRENPRQYYETWQTHCTVNSNASP